AFLLEAYERLVTAPIEVAIVVGDGADGLDAEVRRRLLPAAVHVSAAAGVGAELTPLLADRPLVDGRTTAYVCERYACRRPTTDPGELRAQLDAALASRP
ncbi:MAG TPA: hypothetical protein VEP49_02330, partial [Acidimicrobiia bacterium]|nr:hypothetical protein [Acidimicrobiia bacterium]